MILRACLANRFLFLLLRIVSENKIGNKEPFAKTKKHRCFLITSLLGYIDCSNKTSHCTDQSRILKQFDWSTKETDNNSDNYGSSNSFFFFQLQTPVDLCIRLCVGIDRRSVSKQENNLYKISLLYYINIIFFFFFFSK